MTLFGEHQLMAQLIARRGFPGEMEKQWNMFHYFSDSSGKPISSVSLAFKHRLQAPLSAHF
jgi:hypothetical protein